MDETDARGAGTRAIRRAMRRAIRVAMVADDLYPGFGGQAAATEGHIGALVGLGHEVRALAGEESAPSQPPGVEVERLPVLRPGGKQAHFVIPSARRIEALLEWADVVQINTPTPLALKTLSLARRMGVPSVVGFHTQEENITPHYTLLRPLISPSLKRWFDFVYRRPDCLVAPTPFAARLARGYTKKHVYVVSNGIKLPDDRETDPSLRQRFTSSERFLLVYVGRLANEKHPQELLKLAASLKLLRSDFRLVVAGKGPLRESLEKNAVRLGLGDSVTFPGYVSEEEKNELLRAADLFVMPSPAELQSIATLEAMARGCAVATARISSSAVPEMVEEAECGVIYAPSNPEETAATLSRLLDEPEELSRLQRNARLAAEQHDLHESGARLAEVYESLVRDPAQKET